MQRLTEQLWAKQDQHKGDRLRLFTAVAQSVEAATVLYPGSFVDVAPSFVWPAVTYMDMDRRAERFFADHRGVTEIIEANDPHVSSPDFSFVAGDYSAEALFEPGTFDLLISLYAGPISRHCTEYLRVGGTLLVNPSHGDAALASIDDRYRLVGVVVARGGDYAVKTDGLDGYLIPKKEIDLTFEGILESGRGVAYTKPAFAYLFERIR